MKFMNCGSCHGTCELNNTGICLGCQRGFTNIPQEDAWENSKEKEKVILKERKVEIENALKEQKSKKIPMGQRPRASEEVRERNPKGGKTPSKS